MKKYYEILKKCPLFDGISEGELFTMLHCLGARLVEFEKKFTVMAQGSVTEALWAPQFLRRCLQRSLRAQA